MGLKDRMREQWAALADTWIEFTSDGRNVYRDGLLDSWMLDAIGDVAGQDVIDLGCGEGRFSRMMAERGAKVTGLDFNERFIDFARANQLDDEEYVVGDMEDLSGIPDQSFDLAVSYVNMVDPTSQVDASILNVIFALLANLLFLATDLHLFALEALVDGLRIHPLGAFSTTPADAAAIIMLGGYMLEAAVRLALPVMAVLLLVDLTLGLLNQVHSRMQLITLSFTLKLVAGTAVIYLMLPTAPKVFDFMAEHGAEVVIGLLRR